MYVGYYLSPIGLLLMTANENGLTSCEFTEEKVYEEKTNNTILHGKENLEKYFFNKSHSFDLSLNIEGTLFQKKVWNVIKNISYGDCISYSNIAEAIQAPNSARAVGNAVGQNKFAIIIPCHRVGNKHLGTGHYAWESWRKHYLLKHEKGRSIK